MTEKKPFFDKVPLPVLDTAVFGGFTIALPASFYGLAYVASEGLNTFASSHGIAFSLLPEACAVGGGVGGFIAGFILDLTYGRDYLKYRNNRLRRNK